jgi:transposase InsO family protein
VEIWRHMWPVEAICRMMQVSPRGYRSWRSRPTSRRERTNMKVLAHIREQYSLSLGSYGRPRMTMEFKEAGLDVGERRVGRLVKINGIKPVRTRKHKVTTDSHHRLGVAANWLDGDFAADAPTVSGRATSPISYLDLRRLALPCRQKPPSFSTSTHPRVLQHPPPTFISGWHQPARVRSQGGLMR